MMGTNGISGNQNDAIIPNESPMEDLISGKEKGEVTSQTRQNLVRLCTYFVGDAKYFVSV